MTPMTLNPAFVLWGLLLVTAVGLAWLALRTAMTTSEADVVTRWMAAVFCLLLGVAGLALWFIFLSFNIH